MGQPEVFHTTHWSVVLRAGASGNDARDALEDLCRTYWYPLYFYARRKGNSPEDAEDLVQGFFESILGSGSLARVSAEKGRFRTFLLTGLTNYMASEWVRRKRQKRGGEVEILSLDAAGAEERYRLEPLDQQSPELLFDRRWAETVVAKAVARLREEYERKDGGDRFARLKPLLMREPGAELYAQAGAALNLTENGVKTQVRRLRLRFRDILREELAHTVSAIPEIDEELRHLLSCLTSGSETSG